MPMQKDFITAIIGTLAKCIVLLTTAISICFLAGFGCGMFFSGCRVAGKITHTSR